MEEGQIDDQWLAPPEDDGAFEGASEGPPVLDEWDTFFGTHL